MGDQGCLPSNFYLQESIGSPRLVELEEPAYQDLVGWCPFFGSATLTHQSSMTAIAPATPQCLPSLASPTSSDQEDFSLPRKAP